MSVPKLTSLNLNVLGKMALGALSGFEYVAILAGETKNEIRVQRFGETCVGHGGRNAVGRENFRSLRAFGEAGAERQQRNGRAFRDDAAASDL